MACIICLPYRSLMDQETRDSFDTLAQMLTREFSRISDQFSRFNDRFDRLETRVTEGFEQVNGRVDQVERRLGNLEGLAYDLRREIAKLTTRVEALELRV